MKTVTQCAVTEALLPERFAAWLLLQPETAWYLRRRSQACPIACYLQDTFDARDRISVGATAVDFYEPNGPIDGYALPEWAREFVFGWDLGDRTGGSGTRDQAARLFATLIAEPRS
jgi:hypothetical protein